MSLFPDLYEFGAHFSDCGKFRYSLTRIWEPKGRLLQVIGLNPSTASATTDDPTIRTVKALAMGNGYGGFIMTNLFPVVSADPSFVRVNPGPIEINDSVLHKVRGKCDDVLAAWGSLMGDVGYRKSELVAVLDGSLCISTNKDGNPRHPLYTPYSAKFKPFS